MNFSKTTLRYAQSFEPGYDTDQQILATLRRELELDCEPIMIQGFLRTGNVDAAMQLTMDHIRQGFCLQANPWLEGNAGLCLGILEMAKSLCKEYPVRWRNAIEQLRGEAALTAEGIRSIIGALPDWHQGVAWLYIFDSANNESVPLVFRAKDPAMQNGLAGIKRFLRDHFSRLVACKPLAELDDALRFSLRRILKEAIDTNRTFKAESEKMLGDVFRRVKADTRKHAEREREFEELGVGLVCEERA